VHCDNQARWKLVDDDPDAPEGEKNSEQAPEDQDWIDPINDIANEESPQCRGDNPPLMETATTAFEDDEGNWRQRSVIDVSLLQ
jgi:hypothetical protein